MDERRRKLSMASKPKVILVKDKTVEKAIAEGLQILQAGRDEVEIEVLETGRRGFLGIGARKARVKLTLKERDKGTHLKKKTEVQAEEVKKDTYRDREIIAVEDDRIVLKQLYKNRYPVIRGDRDIRLFENGKLIQGSMVLTEESNIRYQLENKEARNEIIITISEDGLKAFLEIQRINGQLMEAIILPGAGDETDFIIS
ncbi:MAG: hypothetical protein GX175_00060, partial [Halanaerobiaceae bacterium]|nr:hypothetical protein [Halanaerobiaceae bacterium]